jgi:hypothetical protein
MCEAVAEQCIALERAALKTCSKCGVEKLVSEFSKNSAAPDGIRIYCKECCAREAKARQKKNMARDTVVVPQSKKCPGCKKEKSSLDFYKNHRNIDGLYSYCKECDVKAKAGYTERNLARDIVVVPRFKTCPVCKIEKSSNGFTKNYLCKICSIDLHNKRACVDHDHLTNMVRGILCHGCNCGLGQFNDSVELLTIGIDYLRKTA